MIIIIRKYSGIFVMLVENITSDDGAMFGHGCGVS